MVHNYQSLIETALIQPEPQRLLFVFCRAELPDDASAGERAAFQRGEGGALTPVICVDKAPAEVTRFHDLEMESRQTGQDWDVVFVAAMSGRAGVAPASEDAQQPLTMMVESIRLGHVASYLPLNRRGQAINLDQ
ncbi:ribonucleotide reductase subunit alpha [Marinobacter sp. CA1]|uniref:ribonucleotide reductase subunit alpha n=1 Tax=Marinobacter sp. CA1 TaxID=2817656 RepID=UPI001D084AA6|nr:ribonucleotide reductase subunit alpha [Marinobacter sp. CA1]UDL06011.1 ribonucleotide reductase subunit alpha [Marinobacter sp. CA1]